ncbi:E3 ubiquitin-protein ligase TRIM71-like [Sycon ciliatum]|uniref:E3 ubiquitin-protein ligase TRIM71-like n=1 Tax=Sycon ciliatum TaxID=27933 RepID=UPI0031F65FC6
MNLNNLGFDGTIKCPQCFFATPLPVGVEPLRSLPNVVSASVVGSELGQLQSDGLLACDECWDETPATSVCVCGVKFCDDHAAIHPRSKSGKGHTVTSLSASDIESSSSGSSRSRIVPHRCVIHTSDVLKQFCWDCNQLLCAQCCTRMRPCGHEEHEVVDIASAAQTARDMLSTKLSSCTAECGGVVSSAIETVEESIRTAHSQTERASEKVIAFFEPLAEALKKQEEALLAKLDRLRSKKLEPLEKQLCELKACASKGENAANILQSFQDDVELLRVWSWVQTSINETRQTANAKKKPCVSSGIVFGPTDYKQLLGGIRKAGTVRDIAESTLKCPRYASVHGQWRISIDLSDGGVPSTVEQEQLDNIGLEISISNYSKSTSSASTRTPVAPGPGCVRTANNPVQTPGHYRISAKIGGVDLKGSPHDLALLTTQTFDDAGRCSSDLGISNEGRSLAITGTASRWASGCTAPMIAETGTSTLKVKINKTRSGNIFLSACSSSSPNLAGYQQDTAQCFGWFGLKAEGHHTGKGLGQPWQSGDVIRLTVDHDRHTLIGKHERTGVSEMITNVTTKLYWIAALAERSDKITLM